MISIGLPNLTCDNIIVDRKGDLYVLVRLGAAHEGIEAALAARDEVLHGPYNADDVLTRRWLSHSRTLMTPQAPNGLQLSPASKVLTTPPVLSLRSCTMCSAREPIRCHPPASRSLSKLMDVA